MIVVKKILTRDCRYSYDIKKNKAKYKNAFDWDKRQMRFFNAVNLSADRTI